MPILNKILKPIAVKILSPIINNELIIPSNALANDDTAAILVNDETGAILTNDN